MGNIYLFPINFISLFKQKRVMEYIISIFNILSVFYATQNDKKTWFYGILATFVTFIFFLSETSLYLMAIFNLYSFIMCIIGLKLWDNSNEINEKEIYFNFNIFHIFCLLLLGIGGIKCIPSNWGVLNYDIWGTSLAIIATYFLYKKNIVNWIYWILSDLIYVIYAFKNDDKTFIIFIVLLILAICGAIRNITIFYQLNEKR